MSANKNLVNQQGLVSAVNADREVSTQLQVHGNVVWVNMSCTNEHDIAEYAGEFKGHVEPVFIDRAAWVQHCTRVHLRTCGDRVSSKHSRCASTLQPTRGWAKKAYQEICSLFANFEIHFI